MDEDLLAGAGLDSPAQQTAEPSPQERDEWLAGLPHAEVLALLQQLLEGQGLQAERALKSRFSAWRRSLRDDSEGTPRRSVAELLEKSETARTSRFERQKIEQERLNARRRREREAYLATLAKDFPKAWKAAGRQIERGSGLAYDEACRTLVDIAAAYALHASRNAFNQELQRFMVVHMRRKALVQRLVKAGIWYEK